MKYRLLTLTALVGALTFALASPNPAAAHYTDQLHQHGWNTALMVNPNPAHCFGVGLYNGMGQISVDVPTLMTTPGGNQFVAYRAQLEFHDGSTWRDRYFDGSAVRYLVSTPWNYAVANSFGLTSAVWRELGTNRVGPRGTVGWNIPAGIAFRIRLDYYWYFDGQVHRDATPTCTVSSLAGAKAKKAKPSRATLGGRTRRPARTPAALATGAIG